MTLQVAYRPTGSIRGSARNARTHSPEQVAEIAASIRRFGFANPILVDREGEIVAGHGAVIALDPPLGERVVELCRELGCEPLASLDSTRRPPAAGQEQARRLPDVAALGEGPVFWVGPPPHQLGGPDAMPVLLGYPNPVEHPLLERPFMGFVGFRHLAERFALAATSHELWRVLPDLVRRAEQAPDAEAPGDLRSGDPALARPPRPGDAP